MFYCNFVIKTVLFVVLFVCSSYRQFLKIKAVSTARNSVWQHLNVVEYLGHLNIWGLRILLEIHHVLHYSESCLE